MTMFYDMNADFRKPTEFTKHLDATAAKMPLRRSLATTFDVVKYHHYIDEYCEQSIGVDRMLKTIVVPPEVVHALRATIKSNYEQKVRQLNLPSHYTGC